MTTRRPSNRKFDDAHAGLPHEQGKACHNCSDPQRSKILPRSIKVNFARTSRRIDVAALQLVSRRRTDGVVAPVRSRSRAGRHSACWPSSGLRRACGAPHACDRLEPNARNDGHAATSARDHASAWLGLLADRSGAQSPPCSSALDAAVPHDRDAARSPTAAHLPFQPMSAAAVTAALGSVPVLHNANGRAPAHSTAFSGARPLPTGGEGIGPACGFSEFHVASAYLGWGSCRSFWSKYRRRGSSRPVEATEQGFGLPNICSVEECRSSASAFSGLKRQRFILRLVSAARRAPRSSGSPVNVSGPASPSRQSSMNSPGANEIAHPFRSLATKDGAEPSIARSSDAGAVPAASTRVALQSDLPRLMCGGVDERGAVPAGANQDRRRSDDRSCARRDLPQSVEHNCERQQVRCGYAPRGVIEAALAGRVATEARHLIHSSRGGVEGHALRSGVRVRLTADASDALEAPEAGIKPGPRETLRPRVVLALIRCGESGPSVTMRLSRGRNHFHPMQGAQLRHGRSRVSRVAHQSRSGSPGALPVRCIQFGRVA
jgi:hypothetical protein